MMDITKEAIKYTGPALGRCPRSDRWSSRHQSLQVVVPEGVGDKDRPPAPPSWPLSTLSQQLPGLQPLAFRAEKQQGYPPAHLAWRSQKQPREGGDRRSTSG